MLRPALVLMVCLAGTPALAESYAAIAVDPDAGAYGASIHATKAEAEERATAECKTHGGGKACDEHAWVHNGCLALAMASQKGWGIGLAKTSGDAKAEATKKCVETGGAEAACKPELSFCAD